MNFAGIRSSDSTVMPTGRVSVSFGIATAFAGARTISSSLEKLIVFSASFFVTSFCMTVAGFKSDDDCIGCISRSDAFVLVDCVVKGNGVRGAAKLFFAEVFAVFSCIDFCIASSAAISSSVKSGKSIDCDDIDDATGDNRDDDCEDVCCDVVNDVLDIGAVAKKSDEEAISGNCGNANSDCLDGGGIGGKGISTSFEGTDCACGSGISISSSGFIAKVGFAEEAVVLFRSLLRFENGSQSFESAGPRIGGKSSGVVLGGCMLEELSEGLDGIATSIGCGGCFFRKSRKPIYI